MLPIYERTLSRNLNDYLALAGEVERFCAGCGLARPVTFKVRLVLEELVLNLVDHATGSANDRIDLRIEVTEDGVILVLEDDGAPFDPCSAPAFDKSKPLEDRAPRGMGIHLVRSMCQEMSYERLDSRNRLKVVIAR